MTILNKKKIVYFSILSFLFLNNNLYSNNAYQKYLKGNLTESINLYLKDSSLNPNDPTPILNAAMVYKQLDKYDKAIELLQKASLLDKENSDIFSELGWLNFHLANYEKALPYFEKAIKINPNNHRAVLGLASVYSQLKDIVKTVENLQKYKILRKNFSGVDYIFAWNYVNFKMYDKAREYLINTLRNDPSFVEARLPLAGIYLREGKYNEAWNQYYRVLDYAPNHPQAKKMIKIIEGKLTKQPEDNRIPFKILKPTIVEDIDVLYQFKKSPLIRVAIGANNKGIQAKNLRIKIRSFEDLYVRGKKSNKIYTTIKAKEIWTLKYNKNSYSLISDKGISYNDFVGPIIISPKDKKRGTIIIENDRNSLNPYFRYADREYRGEMEFYLTENGIGIINIVPLEVYLMGVVPSEMESKWPYEALKAQAVIARTQALIRIKSGPHKKQGYHICDTEHCQVYRGVNIEKNSTNKAVLETEGEILTYKGNLAYSFYHSNSGGYIQASKDVFGWGDLPYLVSKADYESGDFLSPWEFNLWMKDNPYSYSNYPGVVKDSEFRWMKIIKKNDMEYKLNRDYKIGELLDIIPLSRSEAGNVNEIKIIGKNKSVIIKKEHLIRNAFGFNSLKSTLFLLEINRFKNNSIRNFWFYGGGWGHGIGLSQSGAAGMAGKYNKNYKDILNFYFPKTKIKKVKYLKVKKK